MTCRTEVEPSKFSFLRYLVLRCFHMSFTLYQRWRSGEKLVSSFCCALDPSQSHIRSSQIDLFWPQMNFDCHQLWDSVRLPYDLWRLKGFHNTTSNDSKKTFTSTKIKRVLEINMQHPKYETTKVRRFPSFATGDLRWCSNSAKNKQGYFLSTMRTFSRMESIHYSRLETVYLGGFQFSTSSDFKWPLTSTKTNGIFLSLSKSISQV